MMITDVRTYHVVPRELQRYVQLFEEYAMPVQKRHGLALLLYLITEVGPLNHVLHIWSYHDYADMERKRAARNADPDWDKYLELSKGLLVSQDNKIMRPSRFSPMP